MKKKITANNPIKINKTIKENLDWVNTLEKSNKNTKFQKIRKYYLIQLKRTIKRYKLKFCQIIGYSWDDFLNALTINVLISLLIKLTLSFFSIKLYFSSQIILLLVFLPYVLYFDLFDKLRIKLIYFLKYYLSLPFYEHPGLDWGFDDEPEFSEEVLQEMEKEKAYWNSYCFKVLEMCYSLLIGLRLWIHCEPFLINGIKILIINWFLSENHLTLALAYMLSFIFIISRLIFNLSDKTNAFRIFYKYQ